VTGHLLWWPAVGFPGGRAAAPIVGWWLLTWFDVEPKTEHDLAVPVRGGLGGVGALLGPEGTTARLGGGFSLGSHCRAPRVRCGGGGLRVWLSSAEWTRASFFLTLSMAALVPPGAGVVWFA
jgi:hypothetical protein